VAIRKTTEQKLFTLRKVTSKNPESTSRVGGVGGGGWEGGGGGCIGEAPTTKEVSKGKDTQTAKGSHRPLDEAARKPAGGIG